MKRIAAVFLLFAMLFVCASCASGTENTTTTAKSAEVTTASTVDKNGYELDTLGNDLDYGGETVTILHWSDVERKEFGIDEDEVNGATVEEALYRRNINTEERLHVKLEWEGTKGNASNGNSFLHYVTAQQAGGNVYDLIATYSRTAGMLAVKGLFADLNQVDGSHLNFEKPWWPQNMLETCTINDSLFFCSGDISTNVLHFMYAVWYNMDMIENYHLDNPITLVDNMTWTLDKMIEMTKGLYEDTNSNGVRDGADTYGMCSDVYHLDSFYTGSGLKLIEKDEENVLKISEDFTSTKAIDFVDKLGSWVTSDVCYLKNGVLGSVDFTTPFVEGHILFCPNRVYIADKEHYSHLNEVTWSYGILPIPMYNADQGKYITVLGNPITLWGIMVGQDYDTEERNTAVLECLASYGYRLTTPALFEINMKYKYTSGADNDGVRMFDLVRKGVTIDLGRIFGAYLDVMSEMPSKTAAMGQSWASVGKKYEASLTTKLARQIVDQMMDNTQ